MNYSRTRPARAAPPPIARAAAGVFAALARQTRYVDPILAERWNEIAGEDMAALCRPGRIAGRRADRTLEAHVSSGAAAAQLQMRTEELISRVNAYLGPGAVTRIAIRQTASAKARPEAEGDGGSLGRALANFRAAVTRRNNQK